MVTLQDITDNPDALQDFNTLPRVERIRVITQIDPTFKDLKLQDRFEVLNHIEGMENKQSSIKQEVFNQATQAIGATAPAMIAKGATSPAQLGGAAGVGLQTGSLQRAKEALSPEFQPKSGEKLGYYGGQAAGGLVAAPLEAGLARAGEVAMSPSASSIGNAITGLETKAGIKQIVTEIPSNPAQYVNAIKNALEKGANFSLQNLANAEEQLQRIIEKRALAGSKSQALAIKIRNQIKNQLNDQIEGRANLMKQYGTAKTKEEIIDDLKQLIKPQAYIKKLSSILTEK